MRVLIFLFYLIIPSLFLGETYARLNNKNLSTTQQVNNSQKPKFINIEALKNVTKLHFKLI